MLRNHDLVAPEIWEANKIDQKHYKLEGSKYVYGDAQWLEEYLDFGDDFLHLGGVDLYMPIRNTDSSEI